MLLLLLLYAFSLNCSTINANSTRWLTEHETMARGAFRRVSRGVWHEYGDIEPVVIARPHLKGLQSWASQLRRRRDSFKAADAYAQQFVNATRLLLRYGPSHHVVRVLGACIVRPRPHAGDAASVAAFLASTAVIVEPLRSLIDVMADAGVSVRQRVRLALSAVNLTRWLADIDCVYGDAHAQNYGVDGGYRVKLLDVEAKDFHCARALREWQRCTDDSACHAFYFARRQMFGRLWGAGVPVPNDFACDVAASRCGARLDAWATNAYATCAMLLRHLLLTFPLRARLVAPADAVVNRTRRALSACTHARAQKRPSYAQLYASIAALGDFDRTPMPARFPLHAAAPTSLAAYNRRKRALWQLEGAAASGGARNDSSLTDLQRRIRELEEENRRLRGFLRS